MKLFIKISILFTLFVIIFTALIYNTENVEVTNNDLAKYNWLKPFYNETNLKYLGGYHNVDNGYMELNFRPTTKINFIDFNNFKVIAINHEWQILNLSNKNIIIKKDISQEIGLQNTIIKIEIHIDKSENKIKFKIR